MGAKSLGSWLTRLTGLMFVVGMYTFLYLPILIVIIFSFNNARFPAPWAGATLAWYELLWSSTQMWAALYNSLLVAVGTTVLSLSIALLFVFHGMRHSRIGSWVQIFYLNLAVPEVVLAVGLLGLFSLSGVPLGLRTLIVAHTVLGLGYAVPILSSRFKSLEPALIESSLDLGATFTQTFFKVVLPLLKPALLTAGLLIFIVSFDDFVLSYFCAGSVAQTLPLYILAMLRSGIAPELNALFSLLLVASSLLVLMFCSRAVRMDDAY